MGYLCYHHNDMDGKGAANEVYKYWTSKGIQCTPSMFIQRGYDEPFSEQDYENNTVYHLSQIKNLNDIQDYLLIL